MIAPRLATIDPVDGTLYVIYEDGAVWAYTPHSEDRIAKGWRTLKGGPCPKNQASSISTR